MKTLLLFLILVNLLFQTPTPASDPSPMSVSSFKWTRARQVIEADTTVPARQVIPQNKNFARNARMNEPRGARDPNQDTLDGRSEAMERSVQESRAPKSEPREGFSYRIKVKNGTAKTVEIVFWEYQFHDPANPSLIARRQFLCGVNIGPEKSRKSWKGLVSRDQATSSASAHWQANHPSKRPCWSIEWNTPTVRSGKEKIGSSRR